MNYLLMKLPVSILPLPVRIIIAIPASFFGCHLIHNLSFHCVNHCKRFNDQLIIYYNKGERAVYYAGKIMRTKGYLFRLFHRIILCEPNIIVYNVITRNATLYGSEVELPKKYQIQIKRSGKHIF